MTEDKEEMLVRLLVSCLDVDYDGEPTIDMCRRGEVARVICFAWPLEAGQRLGWLLGQSEADRQDVFADMLRGEPKGADGDE